MALDVAQVTGTPRSVRARKDNSNDINLRDLQSSNSRTPLPPAVPAPPYRHAAPSGPWPWMDFRNIDVLTAMGDTEIDQSWPGYPQNLFGNWTPEQVARSEMLIKCSKNHSSTIHWMDVLSSGKFATSDIGGGHISTVTTSNQENFWSMLKGERPEGIRVRFLCVDDLSKPVLQMLGTRYNIEPFFFTSSINWIPSRYQESFIHGEGDHITITLPFVRTLHSISPDGKALPFTPLNLPTREGLEHLSHSSPGEEENQIDTQAPLHLQDGKMLFIDLLAVHMVRGVKTSTVISYHPESSWCQTSAKRLHKLMLLAGSSVYWQNIFAQTEDPTLFFLTILWYAVYAWDEAFELLYNHVSKLESDVLQDTHIALTRQLHVLQAHLLHYQSLLHHFGMSIYFIQETPNPAMESESVTDEQRGTSNELMGKECKNLLNEIDRLGKRQDMLSSRLKNVMDLAFATVNIEDSRLTQTLTEATVRDSAAMKQISYLTMVFLPASFLASVFGMNVREIVPGTLETLAHYVETTISLTLFTAYIVIALQPYSSFHKKQATFGERAVWPILVVRTWIQTKVAKTGRVDRSEKTADEIM